MHHSPEAGRHRHWRSGIAAMAIVLVAGACVAAAAGTWQTRPGAKAPAAPRRALLSPFGLDNGEGAAVRGMTEYEAEDAVTDATVLGPGFVQGTLTNEASGRAAVQLRAPGQYVQFRLAARANAVDVSYSLPPGTSGALAIYADGVRLAARLPLASSHDYLGGTAAYHFFDDARTLLGHQLAAGTIVRLQAGPGASAAPPTIDVADFYQVPAPAPQPRGSVSVVAEGADRTGRADATAAFKKAVAVATAAREPVWIPPGSYRISSPLQVTGATMTGAGDWYSQVIASQFIANAAAVAGPVNLSGFAILGPPGTPVGQAAISGSLGTGSTLNGLWIQDVGAGLWLRHSTVHLTVQNCEFLAISGDGLNLDAQASHSWLRENFIRNTGGDGLAMWSDTDITVSDNTIVAPNLGNGIAVYGGVGAGVIDNVIADTGAEGSGITIANRVFGQHGFVPLSGTLTVGDNTVMRSGAVDPATPGPMGALRIDSYDAPISHVTINIIDNALDDNPYSAFVIASGRGAGLPVTGVSFEGDAINGVGTVVAQVQTPGSATFTDITASGVGVAGVYDLPRPPGHGSFRFQLGPGNTGWTTRPVLTSFPHPAGPAAPGAVTAPQAPPTRLPASGASRGSTARPAIGLPGSVPATGPLPGNPGTAPAGPAPARDAGPALTASATSVPRGDNVTFRYSTPSSTQSSSNAIVVYDVGFAISSGYDAASATAAGSSGSVTFDTGSFVGSGTYDVYYTYNGTDQVLAGPIVLTVTGAHPTLSGPASVTYGSNVTFSYSAPSGMQSSSNWIGLFPYNRWIPNVNNTITWQYAPGGSGSVTLDTGDASGPGVYYVFYLYNGGWQWILGPVSLKLTGS